MSGRRRKRNAQRPKVTQGRRGGREKTVGISLESGISSRRFVANCGSNHRPSRLEQKKKEENRTIDLVGIYAKSKSKKSYFGQTGIIKAAGHGQLAGRDASRCRDTNAKAKLSQTKTPSYSSYTESGGGDLVESRWRSK